MVDIIEYKPELAVHFEALNLAWLRKYFYVEPKDEAMLGNPQQYILDKGGSIYFATVDENIAGTFALIKIGNGIYELSKMAVDETFQGQNVGNEMMKFCLDKAKQLDMIKLILYSNTKLEPAIHLYKKYGFKEAPLAGAEYTRANIKMEFEINPPHE